MKQLFIPSHAAYILDITKSNNVKSFGSPVYQHKIINPIKKVTQVLVPNQHAPNNKAFIIVNLRRKK